MMKKKSLLFVGLVFVIFGCRSFDVNNGPNLVPSTPASAPNYWCTWYVVKE